MGKVGIVLINYKNWEDTVACLKSLKDSIFTNFCIVLVEACDLQNSVENISKYLETCPLEVKMLPLSKNGGFAYANNIAIRYLQEHSNPEYIWLLNNDTLIKPDTLSELYRFHQVKSQVERVGFVGSKVLYADAPNVIQTIGGTFNANTGYSVLVGKDEPDRVFEEDSLEVDYVIGASMFFKSDLLIEIGAMPEEYFLYYEDVDWCLISKEKGFRNFTCLTSVLLHKQGGSSGNKYSKKHSGNLLTRKYMYSSYLKLYKKRFRSRLYVAYFILFKQFVGRIVRFQFREAFMICKTCFK